jgi:ATP-dependent protease ClpP protease subunit
MQFPIIGSALGVDDFTDVRSIRRAGLPIGGLEAPRPVGSFHNGSHGGDFVVTDEVVLGDLWGDLAQCLRERGPCGTMRLWISSGGGSTVEALRVYRELKCWSGRATARIVGEASSAASVIALGARRRSMTGNGLIVVHEPRLTAESSKGASRAQVRGLEEAWALKFAGVYARETRLDGFEARRMMRRGTTLDAERALSLGFVHEIV